MKIAYNWLKEYINTNISYQEVEKILTFIGLEVESTEVFQSVKGGLDGLVIGEVKTREKHPNADKLSITTVDIGADQLLNIVCGAPNVAVGQKVVVATIGTTLYTENDSFKITKSKIRGESSEGMICAEDEIGLGNSHDGIMILPPETPVGMQAKEYFNVVDDIIFEIGLTPNRIDGASHYGVARDLVAYISQNQIIETVKPSVDHFKIDNHNLPIEVIVENSNACKRYSGVTISGITVKESPEWLKNKLKAIGLNPINNVVDITNFVLHEIGQPLHAFDADAIAGNKVIVKTLPEGTSFKTLDAIERKLSANDLIICNAEKGMCIAGVFGGAESGVKNETKNIFLESAYFDSVYVRKTARRHGLNTDASFRYERGADPNITVYALKRAALLIKEIAGGTISSEIVDIYPNIIEHFTIDVAYKNVCRLIGKTISKEQIKSILQSLEIIIIKEDEEQIRLKVPPYRVDVQREADIIEEVLRIYGYNNVEVSDKVNSTISYAIKPDNHKLKNLSSDYLSSNGFNEIMSNSLTKSSYYEETGTFTKENAVAILNPLSSDLGVLRQTLLFGGLETILYNVNRKNENLKLYEFGNCYYFNQNDSKNSLDKYSEQLHLAIFMSGNKNAKSWNSEESPINFFYLKAYVENVLKQFGVKLNSLEQSTETSDIFSESLFYSINSIKLVEFGCINPKLLKKFDLDIPVFYADIFWDNLVKQTKSYNANFTELPKYPEVKRDLALLLDKSVTFKQIKDLAFKSEKKLLKNVNLFDVYEGQNLGENKKSYAVSFIIQDLEKTLTDKQIEKIISNLINVFQNELGATIR